MYGVLQGQPWSDIGPSLTPVHDKFSNARKRMDRQDNIAILAINMYFHSCTFWDLSSDKQLYLQSGSLGPPCDSHWPTVGKGRSWRTPRAGLLGRHGSVLCGCTARSLWYGSFPVSCSPQRNGSLCSCRCLQTQKAAVV